MDWFNEAKFYNDLSISIIDVYNQQTVITSKDILTKSLKLLEGENSRLLALINGNLAAIYNILENFSVSLRHIHCCLKFLDSG